jgi:hypothetical protein
MVAVDDLGVIELRAERTPNTAVIPGKVLAFARDMGGVPPECILFDLGGGGKEHADALRAKRYNVRTVGFGEAPTSQLKRRGVVSNLDDRINQQEERYAYVSRRVEMHGILREKLNPKYDELGDATRQVFAIPRKYEELRRQLSPIPMWYDDEGRLTLPPKGTRSNRKVNPNEETIERLIGCSPDQSDALILAVFGLVSHVTRFKATSIMG